MTDSSDIKIVAQKEAIVKTLDSKPDSLSVELGQTGLEHSAGIIQEEFLSALKWPKATKVYSEMSKNDPIIGAALFAIEMLIRQVKWEANPADDSPESKAEADFLTSCMDDMEKSWMETINDILSFLPYGYSVHEIVFKKRRGIDSRDRRFRSKFDDGRWGWRKLPGRAQETVSKWEYKDGTGELIGIEQQLPFSASLVKIPRNKFLLFRVNQRKDNPESVSILRNAYRPWFFKKKIEEFEAIGVERDLAGLPIATIPSVYMSADASAEQKQLYNIVKGIVTSVRNNEQAGIVFPSDTDENGGKLFTFDLLGKNGGGKIYDTEAIIQRYNANIAQTMLADFILLGQKSVGSFALSSNKTELFSVAIGAWLDSIADVFNTHAIPQLMNLNGVHPRNWPKLTHGDIESKDLEVLGKYFSLLTKEGLISPDTNLESFLRQAAQAPERAPDAEDVIGPVERMKEKQIASSEKIASDANQKKPQEIINREVPTV